MSETAYVWLVLGVSSLVIIVLGLISGFVTEFLQKRRNR